MPSPKLTNELIPTESARAAVAIAADELRSAESEFNEAKNTAMQLQAEVEATTDLDELADQIRRAEIKRDLAARKVQLAGRKANAANLELLRIEVSELKSRIRTTRDQRVTTISEITARVRDLFDKPEEIASQSKPVLTLDNKLEELSAMLRHRSLALSGAETDAIRFRQADQKKRED